MTDRDAIENIGEMPEFLTPFPDEVSFEEFWSEMFADLYHEMGNDLSVLSGHLNLYEQSEGNLSLEDLVKDEEYQMIAENFEELDMVREKAVAFKDDFQQYRINSEAVNAIGKQFVEDDNGTKRRVDRIIGSITAISDYYDFLTSDSFDNSVEVGEIVEPLSEYLEADVEFYDNEVRGNRGLLIPFLTLAQNYEEHVLDNEDADIIPVVNDHREPALELNIDYTDGETIIEYRQNGPGISEEEVSELTSVGYSTNGGGRGLDLAERVVSSYGGKIDYIPKELEKMEKNGNVPFGADIRLKQP